MVFISGTTTRGSPSASPNMPCSLMARPATTRRFPDDLQALTHRSSAFDDCFTTDSVRPPTLMTRPATERRRQRQRRRQQPCVCACVRVPPRTRNTLSSTGTTTDGLLYRYFPPKADENHGLSSTCLRAAFRSLTTLASAGGTDWGTLLSFSGAITDDD